jgi:hypothetical protein
MKRDTELELLLTIRSQQPEEFDQLAPEIKLKALEYEAMKREAETMKPHTLEPGERSEIWEQVLSWRDESDPRWHLSTSPATRAAALAYEKNRDRVAA